MCRLRLTKNSFGVFCQKAAACCAHELSAFCGLPPAARSFRPSKKNGPAEQAARPDLRKFCIHKKKERRWALLSACRKSLAEFRARRRERHVNHFSRRRVRREKYTPACKCAGCPLLADSSCAQQAAACCRKTPKEFFDSLNWLPTGSQFFL